MTLKLSRLAESALLQILPALIDQGDGPGVLEMYTNSNVLLARLTFSKPSANEPSGGTVTFKPIGMDAAARANGTAVVARIKDSESRLIFECSVGGQGSDAVIELTDANIFAGSPVKITKFTLATAAS